MRKFSENKVQSLKKFVQELSWIFDTYKGNTFSDLYEFLAQQEQNKSLELHKCSIPNDKEYLVGVLPRLFQDKELFLTKGDILDFAEEVLDLHLSKAAKRSKIEYIGMIVCEVSNSNNKKLGKLVDALNRILNNEKDMSDFKKARKEPDFSWNETIAKLGGYYGETNE